jgi:predicted AAA+ superfamily ATPase
MISRHQTGRLANRLGQGKVLLLLGARQVGKTTLVRMLLDETGHEALWLNGDEPDVRALLADATSTRLRNIIESHDLVVIDEAQRVPDVGLTVKLLADRLPGVQVIATGSSSLELSDELAEPLTGRKFPFPLYPLSFGELTSHHGLLEETRQIERRLVFGMYPEIVTHPNDATSRLKELASRYLYQDILALGEIRKPALLDKLLRALALQVGSEVSYNELGQTVGADSKTITRYVDLLEKVFVLFKLPAFSRNVRNEIKKGKKIYFYDNGIRNALIGNLAPLPERSDIGPLWENFVISERVKRLGNEGRDAVRSHFWRTTQQQEIDYVEEQAGQVSAWEIKWNPSKSPRFSSTFTKAYPESETAVVHRENLDRFLLES